MKLEMHVQCRVVYLEALDACTVDSRYTWKTELHVNCTVGEPGNWGCMYTAHCTVYVRSLKVYLEAGDACTRPQS